MQKQKQTTRPTEETSAKKSRFWLYTMIILFLVFVAAYIIWYLLQKPVVADVRERGKVSKIDENKIQERKTYQGKYLTFSYPGNYREITHTTPEEKPIRESIFLAAADLKGQKIAIVVEERETGNFEELPSFQMRTIKPKEYKKESFFENGFKGFLFKKNSQVFEETAFVRKENFIISVSLSSPMSIEGLNKELVDVVGSLRFSE